MEAEKIYEDKQKYRKWFDEEKNNRLRSPIFNQVNY